MDEAVGVNQKWGLTVEGISITKRIEHSVGMNDLKVLNGGCRVSDPREGKYAIRYEKLSLGLSSRASAMIFINIDKKHTIII
jgi:hypothetical protein